MEQPSRASTKRQKRLEQKAILKASGHTGVRTPSMDLKRVHPLTPNQDQVFEAYGDGMNIFLHGCAGTGKTFVSMYLALNDILNNRSECKKLVIIRNAQSSKDIGFLPGTAKQKLEVYESAYRAHCSSLFGRGDAYEILKQKGVIEFESTSFLRGTEINDAIIIVDEVQNMRYSELRTVLTRVSGNSRLLLCGDTFQDDLTSERYRETSGLGTAMRVFEKMSDSISVVEFEVDDIVRSGFVRDFIIAERSSGVQSV